MKKQKVKQKNQKILIWLGIFISLTVAIIYKLNSDSVKIENDNGKENEIENKLTNGEEGNTEEIEYKILSILTNKCRGCGRCTRIDPAHFEMNPETNKAMVISTTNLDSENLALAIQSCPDGAIGLK